MQRLNERKFPNVNFFHNSTNYSVRNHVTKAQQDENFVKSWILFYLPCIFELNVIEKSS